MRKVRVGLDLDGVIYKWQDTAIYLLDSQRKVSHITYKDWGYWDYLKTEISDADWKWLWSDGVTNHGLFRYGSIFKGSREFLQRMESYCDNVVITSRPPSAVRDTMDWLSYQKVPTSEVHIISTTPKSQVQPQCDVYIDDATHNCLDLLQHTEGEVVMPDRPWNQDFGDEPEGFHRTTSWEEIEKILISTYEKINA